MNRGGFSWKRALGVSKAKSNFSRATGVPLTRSGRQRKVGKAMGCCIPMIIPILIIILMILILI